MFKKKKNIELYRVKYRDFPSFGEFVDKKKIINEYAFLGTLMGTEIAFGNQKIIVDYYIYQKSYDNRWIRKEFNTEYYPLSRLGYMQLQTDFLKNQFAYNVASDFKLNDKEIQKVYSKIDELKQKIEKELKKNENDTI